MFRNKTLGWWYWCVALGLLSASLLGWPGAIPLLIAFCAFQAAHFYVREGSVGAMPVQIRLAYLGLVLLGAWAPLRFLWWLPLVGTLAFVTVGYCLTARVLVLMPFNRQAPASFSDVIRTIFSRPMPGAVLFAMATAPPTGRDAG